MLQGTPIRRGGSSSSNAIDRFSPLDNNLFLSTGLNPILSGIISAYYFILGALALPIRLILRKNLGERAFTPFSLLLFLVIYAIIQFYIELLLLHTSKLVYKFYLNPVYWFVFLTYFLAFLHFIRVIKLANSGIVSYSYYRGESRYFKFLEKNSENLFINSGEIFVRLILEPGIVMVISLTFILFYNSIYGNDLILKGNLELYLNWIWCLFILVAISTFCLFLEELAIAMNIRAVILDFIDSQIDMEFIEEKRNKYTVKKPNRNQELENRQEIENIAEIYYNSSGTLKGTLEEESIYEKLRQKYND